MIRFAEAVMDSPITPFVVQLVWTLMAVAIALLTSA